MKIGTLRALFEAGLTDEQVLSVLGTSKPAEQAPAPEQKEEKTDMQQILQAITGLTETIQASNIAGAKNKEPETVDEILLSLFEAE